MTTKKPFSNKIPNLKLNLCIRGARHTQRDRKLRPYALGLQQLFTEKHATDQQFQKQRKREQLLFRAKLTIQCWSKCP